MDDDYISRNQLLAAYDHEHKGKPGRARELIANSPSADVVAVVRCSECEKWQSGWDSTSAPKGTHFCAVTGLFKPADWFCADGAKMDGGAE